MTKLSKMKAQLLLLARSWAERLKTRLMMMRVVRPPDRLILFPGESLVRAPTGCNSYTGGRR